MIKRQKKSKKKRHLKGCFFNAKRKEKTMDCKHSISMLEGRADGIHCKGCGQVFKTIPAQEPAEAETPAEAPAKKPAQQKTTKGGKK